MMKHERAKLNSDKPTKVTAREQCNNHVKQTTFLKKQKSYSQYKIIKEGLKGTCQQSKQYVSKGQEYFQDEQIVKKKGYT